MGNLRKKKSEKEVVSLTTKPNTIKSLKSDFKVLGVKSGAIIIVHCSLSEIGWTVGGPVSVIKALMQVLTPEGTLVMPTFSSDNSDPSQWENPPVPESWWRIICDEMPAFHPKITPTRGMGIIVETFRKWPKVIRSSHPVSSFAAWGKHAKIITKDHELPIDLGEDSPLARIYDMDGKILLIGVNHDNNTSLHLAEYRSDYPGKEYSLNGTAMLVDNQRNWVEWKELNHNTDDFIQLGLDFELKINYTAKKIGLAESRLISQRDIVDFGIEWFQKNRTI